MSNEKISQLASGSPAQSTDLLLMNRGGSDMSLSGTDLVSISAAPPAYWTPALGGVCDHHANDMYSTLENLALDDGVGSVSAIYVYLPARITFTKFVHGMFANSGQTVHARFALYSADKSTLLFDSGQLTIPITGANPQGISITPFTLNQGNYWLAWSNDSSSNTACWTGYLSTNGGQAQDNWADWPTSPCQGTCTNNVGSNCQNAFSAPLTFDSKADIFVPMTMFCA